MEDSVPASNATEQSTATPKIGIIIVTHADYGSALLRAAEFILGPIQDCVAIQVDAGLEVNRAIQRLQEAVDRLDVGRGVLILTDMFGGTPTNLSCSLLRNNKNIDVITGVNLPMLLRVLSKRTCDSLSALAEIAQKAGCEGIIATSELLKNTSEV